MNRVLLFLTLLLSVNVQALDLSVVNAQIEGLGEFVVPANKAVLTFQVNASNADQTAAALKPLLGKKDSFRMLADDSLIANENLIGFTRKPGPLLRNFEITLKLPKRQADQLSSRVGSIFEAMASQKAVNTGLIFDVTGRAALEKRATALALKDAQTQAAVFAKKAGAGPAVLSDIVSAKALSDDMDIRAQPPFTVLIRKNIVAIFKILAKKPAMITAALK